MGYRKGYFHFSQFFWGFVVGVIVGVLAVLYLQSAGIVPSFGGGGTGQQGTQLGIGLLAFSLKSACQ